jgi:thiamine-monophosphate kinase
VPLSGAARRAVAAEPALLERALTGGDDYDCLHRAAEERAGFKRPRQKGVPLPRSASSARNAPPRFVDAGGKPFTFKQLSFSHF